MMQTGDSPTEVDPFRPQVTIITDKTDAIVDEPLLANTSDRAERGDQPYAVVEAVDPQSTDIDPLPVL